MNDETERGPEGLSMLDGEIMEYKSSRTELLREHEINIRFLSIGCNISVGCKSVAFSTVEEGMIALNAYVTNTFEERKKWNKLLDDK
jgi:hypothetical protein